MTIADLESDKLTPMPDLGPKLRILVVDDDRATRDMLAEWLTRSGYEVTLARTGAEALALVRQAPPDVVVTDLQMPHLDGLQLLSLLKSACPQVAVVILTGHPCVDSAVEALREGRAFDYLQKPLRKLSHLNMVIERAAAQRRATPEPVAGGATGSASHTALSRREREIVGLLALGLDNDEIGTKLSLSPKTVRNHLSNMYAKLGVENRTQAVIYWQRHGEG